MAGSVNNPTADGQKRASVTSASLPGSGRSQASLSLGGMTRAARVSLGFAVAPSLPATIYVVQSGLWHWVAIIPFAVAYFHGLLAGCAYLWLREAGRLSASAMLFVSVLVGLIPTAWLMGTGFVASGFSIRTEAIVESLGLILKAAGLGLSGGILWLAIAGRPDAGASKTQSRHSRDAASDQERSRQTKVDQ
jgi:hypothetical protein